ncbi:MAG: Stk1 family PASTA domain-containing Ser/Thr kinase [Acidimicrobiia bacterium]|nr:Stk1 family PASTA domain-containing Ser/Thr kinase [Acidimicrobiia bacterium]
MSDSTPTIFNGRYELHRPLGRGGMAEVYLAADQLLDRPVAVKVLFSEFATDPAFVERFRREATAAANLSHPNIVGVYDWGEAEGTYFIVMEYVEGRSLSEILSAEGPLHPDRVADVGADVAAALGFAHRNGVVHRDVKPGNVLVTQSGQVKVADFGIARATTTATDDSLTQVGTVMGTATYFSPEQARGEPVDPRSDVYSLGCVLYELALGRPPFAGDSPVAIAYKQVHESPVPLRQINPELPEALQAIILKCLAKNPANRYPAAEDLRADLRRFREGQRILAEPVMATAAIPLVDADLPPESDEDDDEPRTSPLFIAGIVALLILLAGMLFLLARELGVGPDNKSNVAQVEVPNVIDETLERAQAILEAKNLKVSIVQEVNPDKAEGIVFDQDPEFGKKVDEGTTVELKVSSGAEATPVPNVTGSQVDQARLLLTARGFTNIRETPTDDESAPTGEVVDQDPKPNSQVTADTEIVLFVSSGPAARPVPNVVGSTLAEASNLLGQAGFTVSQESEASATVAKGLVIRTSPAAGVSASKGATVTVVVSTGPDVVEVPFLLGLTQANATNALTTRGFKVILANKETPQVSEVGTVLSQNPDPLTTAPPGSNVTISVGVLQPVN